ncbi:hypothetical protein ACIRBY_25145 [Streptomyces sp. NPDC096136]|uniref:hypothetical protein n=1 Tax=Streptomyces sp. NPDC096136 TaxID=3366076 RepID=UPI003815C909
MLKSAKRLAVALGVASLAALVTGAPAHAATKEICYQAHVQNKGWLDWQCNGDWAGTRGQALNLEALRVKTNYGEVCLRAHRARYGWDSQEQCAKPGKTIQVGTTGMNTAIEALEYVSTGPEGGYVTGTAHVRDLGDVDDYGTANWRPGWGYFIRVGTTGRGLPIEALKFRWV